MSYLLPSDITNSKYNIAKCYNLYDDVEGVSNSKYVPWSASLSNNTTSTSLSAESCSNSMVRCKNGDLLNNSTYGVITNTNTKCGPEQIYTYYNTNQEMITSYDKQTTNNYNKSTLINPSITNKQSDTTSFSMFNSSDLTSNLLINSTSNYTPNKTLIPPTPQSNQQYNFLLNPLGNNSNTIYYPNNSNQEISTNLIFNTSTPTPTPTLESISSSMFTSTSMPTSTPTSTSTDDSEPTDNPTEIETFYKSKSGRSNSTRSSNSKITENFYNLDSDEIEHFKEFFRKEDIVRSQHGKVKNVKNIKKIKKQIRK